jgi:hypothetical protein
VIRNGCILRESSDDDQRSGIGRKKRHASNSQLQSPSEADRFAQNDGLPDGTSVHDPSSVN